MRRGHLLALSATLSLTAVILAVRVGVTAHSLLVAILAGLGVYLTGIGALLLILLVLIRRDNRRVR